MSDYACTYKKNIKNDDVKKLLESCYQKLEMLCEEYVEINLIQSNTNNNESVLQVHKAFYENNKMYNVF